MFRDAGRLLEALSECVVMGLRDSVTAVFSAAVHACASFYDVHTTRRSDKDPASVATFGVAGIRLPVLLHCVKLVLEALLARCLDPAKRIASAAMAAVMQLLRHEYMPAVDMASQLLHWAGQCTHCLLALW